MKISIILAHPDKDSFNHAIASTVATEVVQSGHGIYFHDLYAEGFDPVLPGKEMPSGAVLPQSVFGDPLKLIWKKCIFELCGVKIFYREMFGVVVTSTFEQRRQWLDKVRNRVNHYFPTPNNKPDGFVNRGD